MRTAMAVWAIFLAQGAAAETLTRVLVVSPQVASRPSETHAALVLSNTSFSGDITFRGRVQTVRQLRVGSPPNPWECAWVVWNYHGGRFYYLALKPGGWEIGKHDKAFHDHQKFLRTGDTPHEMGVWHDFEITQTGNEIRVQLNGVEVAAFLDTVRPYKAGQIGFYTEDAEIQVDDVTSPFNDDFEDYPLQSISKDGHRLKNWFMQFLGHGGASISLRPK